MDARSCCGCSAAEGLQYVSSAEVAWQCGYSLALLHLQSGQQRVLGSSGQGIQTFAASAQGVLAVALKGYRPAINIFSTHDLQQQATLSAGSAFGYTALALSHDGELLAVCADHPDLELSVWQWSKGVKLAAVKLHAPVTDISFHPADNSCLLTTCAAAAVVGEAAACMSGGSADTASISSAGQDDNAVTVWQLHRLWDRHELQPVGLKLHRACQPTCHAWAPEGVYVGCSDGSVACISPETGATMAVAAAAAAAGDASAAAPATPARISSIAVNKHWLAVGCSGRPDVSFYQRYTAGSKQQQEDCQLRPLGSVQVSSVGCAGLAFGGPLHADLAVSTVDGSLLLVSAGRQSPSVEGAQPDPGNLQVEPLADWHVGAITGIAAAASGSHLVSCGMDGSIRVWAAAAAGQLVSKRDVGGHLTCCAAAGGAGGGVLAVGSQAGVLRLVSTMDLGSLPVAYHSRLFKCPVTHTAFSTCGGYLAAVSGSTGHVALLKVAAAGQEVQVLGYVQTQGTILSVCWLPAAGSRLQPQLLLGLANATVLALTAPARPPQHGSSLDLEPAAVHAVTWSAPTALQALTLLQHDSSSSSSATQARVSGTADSSAQVLAAGCDGKLYWLQLPPPAAATAAASAPHGKSSSTQAVSILSKVPLPWPAVALAVSPSGHEVLAAAADGAALLLPTSASAAVSMVGAAGLESSAGQGVGAAGGAAVPSTVLAWSPDSSWAATAGADGSLLVYATGSDSPAPGHLEPLAPPTEAVQDREVADDPEAPIHAEAVAAVADQAARTAAQSVRDATLQRLQDLKSRLAQALEANAVAPPDQQLLEAELVLNSQLLGQLRAGVLAEESQLLTEVPRRSNQQEVQAKRLKALCWDAFQVKRAVCTGLKSADTQVWNFQLPVQDDTAWAQVAEERREQLLASHKQLLDQDYYSRSAAPSTLLTSLPAADSTGTASRDNSSGGAHPSEGGAAVSNAAVVSAAAAAAAASDSDQQAQQLLALLGRVKACADARACSPADLLLPELAVTTPKAKAMQAELYKRMVWQLKTQFNQGFDNLVKQKHSDANRLADLNTRVDELIRELVKIHLVLNPAAAAAATDGVVVDGGGGELGDDAAASGGGSGASSARLHQNSGSSSAGQPDSMSASQLSAELVSGRLVPHWSPEENLEEQLLHIQPGEVKVAKYLTPAERAKADAEEAAADAARRAAAADSSRARALQQMMGGRLERSVDEVSELVTSRPSWMVSGDPSSFSEEQLKEYKDYMAREAAAIEDRLKRKGIMETELRTLKAAADDVATKFDTAVAALAAKRLELLAEVTALEVRVLQLEADKEVANVTAGSEAQHQAAQHLQAAQAALAAVEQEVASTQHMHDQQQEALSQLHAEEKATDRAFKRDFSHVDPLVLPRLTAMYKTRLVPGHAGQAAAAAAAAAAAGAGAGGRAGSASRPSVAAAAAGGGGSTAGPSPRPRHAAAAAASSPRAAGKVAASQLHGSSATDPLSAQLVFETLQLPGAAAAAALAGAAPHGAHVVQSSSSSSSSAAAAAAALAAHHHDLCGPLGPSEVGVVQLREDQMPEELDEQLWFRFLELHSARTQLDLAVREQTAQVLCLKRQVQLLLQRRDKLAHEEQQAAAEVEGLVQQQYQALHDVEVQLRLKQGQVEVWPSGLASIAPEALLVGRQEVKGLNSIIFSKGEAKLEMLRKMKEFKRGIHQLEWENKKCEMEAEDVTSLTQQLQLLHVTKEFQQQVKAGSNSNPAQPGSSTATAGVGGVSSGGGAAGPAAANAAAANKEVASLENLLKVRETLHASAVEQKRRQLRSLEGQMAAKRNENATLALHMAGLERMLDEAARLRSSAAADDATSAADRKARSLAMQAKLRDIADAQAAEIAAAQRELQVWQQRCFPCLPGLPGEDDQQPSGGADQAGTGGPSSSSSIRLPEIKGARAVGGAGGGGGGGSSSSAALGAILVGAGGFAPHGARAARLSGALGASGGGSAAKRHYIGPDGKPELLGAARK